LQYRLSDTINVKFISPSPNQMSSVIGPFWSTTNAIG